MLTNGETGGFLQNNMKISLAAEPETSGYRGYVGQDDEFDICDVSKDQLHKG